jgi:uncharacterized cupredoxin-like copper-binding protein/Cu/Ag efflux protein CusF
MTHRSTSIALLLALSASLPPVLASGTHAGGHDESAIGEPGKATNVTRSVQIDMSDAMRFSPASIAAKQDETIRFVVTNSGKLKHELVLGTDKALKAHNEVMKKHPEMEHADPNMVTVAPGQTGELVWRFTKAGKVDFACLQPGHYEAGMKGLVRVAAGTKTDAASGPSDMADGEVRKVDRDAKKITLKHGELKALDMPPMTMVFQVGDPALLDSVKVGDKVKFKAEKIGGAFVVTAIEAVR